MRQSHIQLFTKTAVLSAAVAGVMMLSGCDKKQEAVTPEYWFPEIWCTANLKRTRHAGNVIKRTRRECEMG